MKTNIQAHSANVTKNDTETFLLSLAGFIKWFGIISIAITISVSFFLKKRMGYDEYIISQIVASVLFVLFLVCYAVLRAEAEKIILLKEIKQKLDK